MGQKIHPIGFRVGHSRKWNSSWFAVGKEWKTLFFYQKEVENFFKYLFYYYPYSKISRREKVILFDVKLFKYSLNKLFLFVFFYKFRTKRRKEVRPVLGGSLKKVFIPKRFRKKPISNFSTKDGKTLFYCKETRFYLPFSRHNFGLPFIINKKLIKLYYIYKIISNKLLKVESLKKKKKYFKIKTKLYNYIQKIKSKWHV